MARVVCVAEHPPARTVSRTLSALAYALPTAAAAAGSDIPHHLTPPGPQFARRRRQAFFR
eukprot:gene5131-62155_t